MGHTNIRGITLVEETMNVGTTVLQAGDVLLTADSGSYDRSVMLYRATGVGDDTTSGTLSTLFDEFDPNFHVNADINSLTLLQHDMSIGGFDLKSGDLLMTFDGTGGQIGSNNLTVDRHKIYVMRADQTTNVVTAFELLDGHDLGLLSANERPDALDIVAPNFRPDVEQDTQNLDENTVNGTLVGTVSANDPEGGTLHYAIISGNTDGAFTINASNGQITVANSTALDFETNPVFTLTVAAIDPLGAYGSAEFTVNLNDLDDPAVISGDISYNGLENDVVSGTLTTWFQVL
jgi:hypothetical protein